MVVSEERWLGSQHCFAVKTLISERLVTLQVCLKIGTPTVTAINSVANMLDKADFIYAKIRISSIKVQKNDSLS